MMSKAMLPPQSGLLQCFVLAASSGLWPRPFPTFYQQITPVLLTSWSRTSLPIQTFILLTVLSNRYRYYIIMLSTMGVGDLVCRLVIGPLITIWKLEVTKLYAFSQLACAISIASFPMVMNGVQMIIQGFLFSVTFGCQCLLLGNLSTNPLMITVGLPTGLNLMAFYFVHSARTPCSLWK